MRKSFFRVNFSVMKGYFTAKQTAARLGVSDARVRQMIKAGVIKNVEKFGRDNVIPESEVVRLESIKRRPGRPLSIVTEASVK